MPVNHVVQQGDSITSLAFVYGFFPDTIWDLGENADLKALRETPDVLLPGDVVFIPDKRLRKEPCEPCKHHRFRRKGVPAKARIQVFYDEKPSADEAYMLLIDNVMQEGTTDAEGYIEVFIPPNAEEGRLLLGAEPPYRAFFIKFGHLDPITEAIGIQKRLCNLGYYCDVPDGEALNASIIAALRLFQERMGLPETGEPDAATLDALEQMHDQRSQFPDAPEDAASPNA